MSGRKMATLLLFLHCPVPQGRVAVRNGLHQGPHATAPRNATSQRKQNSDRFRVPFIFTSLELEKLLERETKVELDLLIFHLYLLFVNICRSCSAQKCFQDCHQHWFAWVKPSFMRGATESGQLFPAMKNKWAALWLLTRSQLSHPPASNRENNRRYP